MSLHAHGFRAWIVQRVSALYLLIFFLICLVWFINATVISYEYWLASFKSPLTIVLVSLFFIAIFVHVWVGVRDIIVDYVHPFVLRLLLLSLILLFLFGLGVWVVVILASVYVQ